MPTPSIREIQDLCISDNREDLTDLEKLYFPIGLTWGQLVNWALRVEKWRFNISGGTSDSGLGAASIDGQYDGIQRSGKPNENRFSCGIGFWADGPANSATGASCEFSMELFNPPAGLSKITKNESGSLFYPCISLSYFLFVEYGPDEEGAIEGSSIIEDEFASILPVSLFGFEVPVLNYSSGDDSGISNITAAEISPYSWYPCNPNDGGGPIVDASTGAILRQL